MLGAGEEDHEGEGGDCGEAVDDDEGYEEGRLDIEEVRAGGAGVDELPLLPQLRPTQTEAGLGGPGGRGLEGGRAGGRGQRHQVEAVGDGRHQAEHGGDQGHQEAEHLDSTRVVCLLSLCLYSQCWRC